MVKEEIATIFKKNKKRYGYRRITKEQRNNGIWVNHNTVQKLMKQLGLYYNNHRIKLKLNGLSPVQYRIQTVWVA